jgi:Mn2+/Fe2+ NRAMP family transporter
MAFRGAIAAVITVACALNFTPVNPMRALFWTAVLNGVIAVPLMAAMMHLSTRESIMGSLKLPAGLSVLGWTATAAMGCSVVAAAVSWLA